MNKKPFMIKGVYYMEVSGSDGKKIVWEIVEYHFINDSKYNSDIVILGFKFIYLINTRGVIEKG